MSSCSGSCPPGATPCSAGKGRGGVAMAEAFSFNREFDFVRLEGLSRATGRPPHEWDLYIVKELVDNALDADDDLWRGDPARAPSIDVRVAYLPVEGTPKQEFEVR